MQFLDLTVSPSTRVSSYAGFFDRALAKIIDLVVVRVCLGPFVGLGPFSIVFGPSDQVHGSRTVCIAFGLFCLYSAWLESSKQQATLGKRLVGILVEDNNGKRISFPRALLRSIMQYTGIGYLLVPFTERKQGLHDLMAHTQVTTG